MPAYHYHPDGMVYIRHPSGDYAATASDAALDYGAAIVAPVDPYNEIYYDLTDEAQRENRNNFVPLNDLIETPDTAIEAIINDYANMMVARDARENPPLTLQQKKEIKITQLKNEAVARMNARLEGILTFEQVQIMREQYLSIDLGSRNPTVNFQYIIDCWQAGKDAASLINGYATELEVDNYNITTDPVWPI